MARIPQQTYQSPRSSGVEIPEGAFYETARANAQLFEAIGGIPREIKSQLDKAQDIRNEEDVAERSREMRALQAEYMQELQTPDANGNLPDPSSWLPNWKKKLDEYENDLKAAGVPPVVLRAVTEQFKEFAGKSSINITGAALKENRRKAQRGFESDYGELIRNEQWDEADEFADKHRKLGTIDDIAHQDYKRGTDRARRASDLNERLGTDPLKYYDDLLNDRLGLPPEKNRNEIKRAEREIAQQKRDALTELNKLNEAGGFESREDVEEALKDFPILDEDEKQIYLNNWKDDSDIPYREQANFIDRANALVNEFTSGSKSFDEYAQGWNELSAEAQTYGGRHGSQRIRNFLQSRNPETLLAQERRANEAIANDTARKSDAEMKEAARVRLAEVKDTKNDITQVVEARIKGQFKIRTSEQKFNIDNDPEGINKARFQARLNEKNLILREALEEELGDWALSQPEPPTRQQIIEQLDKIQPEFVNRLKQRGSGQSGIELNGQQRHREWRGDVDTAGDTMLPAIPANAEVITFNIPKKRGVVRDGYAVGKASTYGFKGDKFEEAHTFGGMNSVGTRRGTEPWWVNERKPTIALAPAVARSMGLRLPIKHRGQWDTSHSEIEVILPDGQKHIAVYAENGMYSPKYPNSHNKLIDLSEQFQELSGVKGGTNLNGVRIRPLR